MTYSTKKKMTHKKALNLIHNYSKNFDIYLRLMNEYEGVTTGAKAPKYGIEATLPKGNVQRNDLIDFEVQRLMKQDKTLQRYADKIEAVKLVHGWITDEEHLEILDMRMSGRTLKDICMTFKKSKSQIYPVFDAIADLMVERL